MAQLTRAETLTGTKKKIEFFSDFLDSFGKSPVGDQLGKVINENSVNQSLKNIIMTNNGERPFQPYIGSDIMSMLFEPNVSENYDLLETMIKNAIEVSEPRVNLVQVLFPENSNENTMEITLIYNLINNPEPITLPIILKRVR